MNNDDKQKSLYGAPNADFSTKVTLYTIIVYSENLPGLLQRVVTTFTRRKKNIESLSVSKSETKGLHRYTIVINSTEKEVQTIVKQLERIIEVVSAAYHVDSETVYQEVALYKVPLKALLGGSHIERMVRRHNARIMEIESDFVVIEKTGQQHETQLLFEDLEDFGLLEFVRSGRIAVSKKNQKPAERPTSEDMMQIDI